MSLTKRKKIVLWVLAALVLAVGGWVASRWKAWFYNPPEPPYVIGWTPQRVLLTFGNEQELSRNVSWVCGDSLIASYLELKCADSSVEIVDALGEVFQSRSGKGAYYVARLRNLDYDSYYSYRVHTGDSCSQWYGFHTQKKDDDVVRFVFFGDVQDTIGGCLKPTLRAAFDNWKEEKDFVIFGGDLTERPIDEAWKQTFECIDSIGQALPILTCTGNHDYLKGITRTLERRFALVHSYFLDSEVEGNMVYALNYKNTKILLLDSNRDKSDLAKQRQWLEEQLRNNDKRWTVVVVHHPMKSVRGHDHSSQRKAFDDLIQEYKVDLVLQGHEHAYASRIEGQTLYTISHMSPKKYKVKDTEEFGKVDTLSAGYVQYVTITDSMLRMETYDTERRLVEKIERSKK